MKASSGWISPWLGVRFELDGLDLCLTGPDGWDFVGYVEMAQRAKREAQRAAQEAQRANAAKAKLARLRALLEQRRIDFSR